MVECACWAMAGKHAAAGIPEQAQEPVVDASKEVGHGGWRTDELARREGEVSEGVDGRWAQVDGLGSLILAAGHGRARRCWPCRWRGARSEEQCEVEAASSRMKQKKAEAAVASNNGRSSSSSNGPGGRREWPGAATCSRPAKGASRLADGGGAGVVVQRPAPPGTAESR